MTSEKLNKNSNNSCPKCGHIRVVNETECPKCGIIYDKYEDFQKRKEREGVEFAENQAQAKKEQLEKKQQQSKEKKLERDQLKLEIKRKIVKLIKPSLRKGVSFFLVVSLLAVGIYLYTKKEQDIDYINNLNLANSIMAVSTIKCIEMSQKYSTIWREAIEDKYNSDFNDDIRKQRIKFEIYGDIKKIDKSKELAEDLLQKLNQPKELCPEAHKKIVELYGVYSQLHSLAQSPSGSLMSYNKQVNDLQSEYIRIINELRVLIPKEE